MVNYPIVIWLSPISLAWRTIFAKRTAKNFAFSPVTAERSTFISTPSCCIVELDQAGSLDAMLRKWVAISFDESVAGVNVIFLFLV